MTDERVEGWGLPSYWLPRPRPTGWGVLEGRLRRFTEGNVVNGAGGWLPAPLPCPAWAYLTWLGEEAGLMLHGSRDPAIDVFVPRTPSDHSPDTFSKQRAVFATTDGIWAIFYAILERSSGRFGFLNAALRFGAGDGRWSPTHYYFSLSHSAPAEPWGSGAVYLLPRDGFRQQPPGRIGDRPVLEPHFARQAPVRPLAKLRVGPRDFPFLGHVARHDRERVDACSLDDPYGFPWRES